MKGNDQPKAVKHTAPAASRLWRAAVTLLLLCLLGTFCLACGVREEPPHPADFGKKDLDLALDLAHSFPFRSPYSEAEKGAREFLVTTLEQLGLKPEVQSFSEREGSGRESANVVLTFPGTGFKTVDPALLEKRGQTVEKLLKDPKTDYKSEKRQVLVCANYDVVYGEESAEEKEGFDGLSDNASGVATLLTLAEQLKDKQLGYDVQLVFLGAGHDRFRGAEAFVEQMSEADQERTDAVYVVESILAGDKLYAHAGRNSLTAGDKHEKRRKLYEMTGFIFEADLPTLNEIDVYYNESLATVEYPPGSGNQVPYREFTLKDGNYRPFDEAGLPIVYIESGNYDFKQPEAVKESTRNVYESTSGQVSGTGYDASASLIDMFGEDLFSKRINNVAYILEGCLERGVYNGLAVDPAKSAEDQAPATKDQAPAAEDSAAPASEDPAKD